MRRANAVLPIPGTTFLLETDGNTIWPSLIVAGQGKARIPAGEKPVAAIHDSTTGDAFIMSAESGAVSIVAIEKAAATATVNFSD